jgi:hypothetical protein
MASAAITATLVVAGLRRLDLNVEFQQSRAANRGGGVGAQERMESDVPSHLSCTFLLCVDSTAPLSEGRHAYVYEGGSTELQFVPKRSAHFIRTFFEGNPDILTRIFLESTPLATSLVLAALASTNSDGICNYVSRFLF